MLLSLEMVDYRDVLFSILTDYHSKHDLNLLPVKVDFLKPLIEGRGIVDRIDLFEVEFSSNTLAATIEIFETSDGVIANIKVASALDEYWRRIAICKEMYHCLIDCTEKLRVQSVDDLMTLTEGLTSRFSASHSKRMSPALNPLDTEAEAEFLALETLFPFELRQHHMEQYHRGQISATRLATAYVIPEYYIPKGMARLHMDHVRGIREGALVPFRASDAQANVARRG
jgi:hypothetical protein